jgi:hypothetical protein
MKTVREWEDTVRFGHLGSSQNSQANSARVVEYFSDSYPDPKEAVEKAELFLSIYDYIGRHVSFFSRKDMVEELGKELFSVEPALLRAVHFVYTMSGRLAEVHPKKVYQLARAYKDVEADC